MREEDNGLGDFFRKRLSQEDDFEDWDKPSRDIRASILEEISQPVAMTSRFSFPKQKIGLVAASLLLLMTAGYAFFLQGKLSQNRVALNDQAKQIEDLQQQVQVFDANEQMRTAQVEKIQTQQFTIEALETKVSEQKTALNIANQTQKNRQRRFLSEKKAMEMQLEEYKRRALLAEAKTQALTQHQNHSLIDNTITPILNTNNQGTTTKNTNINTNSHEVRGVASVPSLPTLPQLNQVKVPDSNLNLAPLQLGIVENTRIASPKKWEVGVEGIAQTVNIPMKRGFKKQKSVSDGEQHNDAWMLGGGIRVAYSPVKNLWIQSGLRKGSVEIEREFKMGIKYDAKDERMGQGGIRENDLAFNTQTVFSDIETDVRLEVDETDNLEEGDLIEVELEDYMTLSYTQIPLGLNYFNGKGKLKWFLQGGVQWNEVVMKDYGLEIEAETKGKSLYLKPKKEYGGGSMHRKTTPNKQYFSTYAGAGLDYEIASNWHARASMNYNYDFLTDKNKGFSDTSNSGTIFKVGLSYQF